MTPRSTVRERVRGLYAITDADTVRDPVDHGAALLAAGVRLLQLRCKSWSPDEVLRAARDLAPRCRAVGATFLVNDSAEIAVAAGADGAHVGQTDGDGAILRATLGPDRLLGRSTGVFDELGLACVEADYVAFGPIFATPRLSRPKPVRGIDLLGAARALVPPRVPLVAIGGIGPDNVAAIREAGADAWAVIGALAVPAGELTDVVRALS